MITHLNKTSQNFLFFTFVVVFLEFSSTYSFGQNANLSKYPDMVYRPYIETVILKSSSNKLSSPLLILGKNTLYISFDDLSSGIADYSYALVHCDMNWQPSNLSFFQFGEGFSQYQIFDYSTSNNTTQSYTHYQFSIPNQYMKIKMAGNYILKVFETGYPDKIIFTRRFMVCNPKVSVTGVVRFPSMVKYRNTGQEVAFNVSTNQVNIPNIYTDLKVVITQNNRWDNAITDIKPRFVQNNSLSYDYRTGQNVFMAGNEWRYIDIKTLQLATRGIKKIYFARSSFQIIMEPCTSRAFGNYQYKPDLNGRYVIYNQDNYTGQLNADYGWVYFTIDENFPLENKDVYLIGEFTFYDVLPMFKFQYYPKDKEYRLATRLKQGYYNYMLVTVPKSGEMKGHTAKYEGNYAQTENTYQVYVYIRESGSLFYKLLGFQNLSFKE